MFIKCFLLVSFYLVLEELMRFGGDERFEFLYINILHSIVGYVFPV